MSVIDSALDPEALAQARDDLDDVSRINTQLGVAVAASPGTDLVSLGAMFGYDVAEAASSAIGPRARTCGRRRGVC